MIRKRATTIGGPLSPGVVRVVLAGWALIREADEAEQIGPLFDLFQGKDPAVAAVWRAHAAFLLAEATRLGIRRRRWFNDRVPRFFGEHCAAHVDHHDPAA